MELVRLFDGDWDGSFEVKFIEAKSYVTPIRIKSIPRMELNGLLIMTGLMKSIINALQWETEKVYMWSDSKTAFNWIQNDKDSFKAHVQAHVSEIQETFSQELFCFVPGKQNLADALTKHTGSGDQTVAYFKP
ncbi:uncharacterized protein [Lepeophtheirus salmonis]|uniref:uncharacterized protein n=1 Tax=Lepeophtheirus salmonis TaxID=72036 RepID=UPI003AF3EB63